MEPRMRLVLWAGMALLAGLWMRPASEVLAADWRGSVSVPPMTERARSAERGGAVESTRPTETADAMGASKAENGAAPAAPRERRS